MYDLVNCKRSIVPAYWDEFLNVYETVCSSFMRNCTEMETNEACKHAERVCHDQIEGPISTATDFDVYDVRLPAGANVPPKTYVEYLREGVLRAIGARKGYVECPGDVYYRFKETGDSKSLPAPTYQSIIP